MYSGSISKLPKFLTWFPCLHAHRRIQILVYQTCRQLKREEDIGMTFLFCCLLQKTPPPPLHMLPPSERLQAGKSDPSLVSRGRRTKIRTSFQNFPGEPNCNNFISHISPFPFQHLLQKKNAASLFIFYPSSVVCHPPIHCIIFF